MDKTETEEKILIAAKTVFLNKGLDGARMQEIADEAGINKALLHYYYRGKNKLFNAVFQEIIQELIPQIESLFQQEGTLMDKLELFVNSYTEFLLNNPFVPMFIMHEIQTNADKIADTFGKVGINPKYFIEQMQKEIEQGAIKPIDPRNLIINIVSLCVFPIAARPIMERLLFDNNTGAYHDFIAQRKQHIVEFIKNAITL